MGQRSAEALARRAAKRGRTVEEQAKADLENDSKRHHHAAEEAAAPAAAAAAPAVPARKAAAAAASSSQASGLAVGRDVWKLDEMPEGTKLKKDAKAGWCASRPRAAPALPVG